MGSLTMRAPAPAASNSVEADGRAPSRAADGGGGAAEGGGPPSTTTTGGGGGGGGRLMMMLHEWSYEAQSRFLKELERVEPPPLPRTICPQRADLLRLYAAFLRTPHFAHWWERRRQRADAAL